MRAVLAILFTSAIFAPSIARADQCALNDGLVNARAAELARKSASVIEWCELCKGSNMVGPFTIKTIDIKNRQVEINGKPVDLAYTFVHTKGDEYQNLGLAAGCTAHGVSKTIKSSKPAVAPPPPNPAINPAPPMPPPTGTRPPMPRVSAGDDLAGTWKIWLRHSVSSCHVAGVVAPRHVTWTISSSVGTLSLMTDSGRELVAPVPPLDRGGIKVDFRDGKLPQSGGAHIDQFLKDQFFGQIVIVEKGCATVYSISGSRIP